MLSYGRSVDNSNLIIRIVFRSGRVAEERGTETNVWELFADDHLGIIDHIQTIDLSSMEVAIFDVENRGAGQEVLFVSDLIPGWTH